MYCSKCRNEIKNGQKFCTKCGARLIYGSAPGKKQSSVKTSENTSAGGQKEERVPVNVPRKPRTHEFSVDFSKTTNPLCVILMVVSLFGIFLTVCCAICVTLIGEIDLCTVVGVLLLGLVFLVPMIYGIIYLIVGKKIIYFKGRKITTKTFFGKKESDCSDIISITCGKFLWRYHYIYHIEWRFREQKKHVVSTAEEGFYETAGYFLDMIESGVISPNAVTAENKELLRRYEVRAWD